MVLSAAFSATYRAINASVRRGRWRLWASITPVGSRATLLSTFSKSGHASSHQFMILSGRLFKDVWGGPATPNSDEESGADLALSLSPARLFPPFSVLVVGPARRALRAARALSAVAASDFSGVPPELYEGVYAVHIESWESAEALIAGAKRVVFIPGLPAAPPPGALVATCARLDLCEAYDCICGGALRI